VAEVDLTIAGRSYRIACRDGEEDNLRSAAALVDGKSREALAGLGTLSETRQLLFASLLLADQLIDNPDSTGQSQPAPEIDPVTEQRVLRLAERLESLAQTLEEQAPNA
jgi:cell division protein ZapA